jgi:hypothetical protein
MLSCGEIYRNTKSVGVYGISNACACSSQGEISWGRRLRDSHYVFTSFPGVSTWQDAHDHTLPRLHVLPSAVFRRLSIPADEWEEAYVDVSSMW